MPPVAQLDVNSLDSLSRIKSNTPKIKVLDHFARRLVENARTVSDGIAEAAPDVIDDADYRKVFDPLVLGDYCFGVGLTRYEGAQNANDESLIVQVCVAKKGDNALGRRDIAALQAKDGYSFALYNHNTKLISRSVPFEVTSDRTAAYSDIELKECTEEPDAAIREELEDYRIQPDSPYPYSLVVFKDGALIAPGK